jgi:sulfatase maturation enzyme AslB (radical SAM superfamily)
VINVFGAKKEYGRLEKMTCNSKTFCIHPFTGLATREDGAIQVCCRSHPIGNIQDSTLEEIWNNDNMRRIRQQVLHGERPAECEPCFVLEDQGVESLRQRHIAGVIPESRITLYPHALNGMDRNFKMPFEFPTMEIKLNNLCNLKCRMCHPMDSTSWNDWKEVEEFYIKENNFMVKAIEDLNLMRKPYLDKFDDNPNWWTSLEKLLPYFRRVEFAGGEPLMDPQHYRILDMLKPYGRQIEIKYATNGTTLGISKGRTIHDYWPHFKSVAVNISIDGIDDVYNYIRGNGDWNQVVENIKEIQKISNVSRIVGAVAVQVSNVLTLDEMIVYFLDELGIVFYTNIVKYPNVLSVQVLPPNLKILAVQRLNAVKDHVPKFKHVKENPILLDLTIKQINGIINYINATDQSDKWEDCVEFNRRLDKTRNQIFTDVTPEFKNYV